MWPPQAEQAKLSSRFDDVFRSLQPRRRARYHRGTLDRPAAGHRVQRRARAGGRHARRLRRARPRHGDPRDRRAEPPTPRRPHRRDPAHRRLGLWSRRGGRRDALAQGAGARGADGRYVDALAHFARGAAPFGAVAARNTTLAVVATNATLDRTTLESLAQAAGDALARRIVPYGTLFDGDVVFAVSTAAATPATPLQAEALPGP